MYGVKMITSDDHAGLKAARTARFPGVKWQRCQFHLQQNALHYVTRQGETQGDRPRSEKQLQRP